MHISIKGLIFHCNPTFTIINKIFYAKVKEFLFYNFGLRVLSFLLFLCLFSWEEKASLKWMNVLQKRTGSYTGIVYSVYSPFQIFPVYLMLVVASSIFPSPSKLRSDRCRHSVQLMLQGVLFVSVHLRSHLLLKNVFWGCGTFWSVSCVDGLVCLEFPSLSWYFFCIVLRSVGESSICIYCWVKVDGLFLYVTVSCTGWHVVPPVVVSALLLSICGYVTCLVN